MRLNRQAQNIGIIIIVFLFLVVNKDNLIMQIIPVILLLIFAVMINFKSKKDAKETSIRIKDEMARYETILQAMNGAIWEWDNKTRTISMSANVKEILGIEYTSLSLDKWYEGIIKADQSRVYKYIDNICSKSLEVDINIQYRIKNANGDIIYIQQNGKGLMKDNIHCIFTIISDVTEKKKEEELVKDNIEKYKQIVEGSKDIIYCWQVNNGQMIFDNKISNYINIDKGLSEISSGEFVIPYEDWKNKVYEKDIDRYTEQIRVFLQNDHNEYYENEYRIVAKNTEIKWMHSKGKKVLLDDGKILIYGSISDITDRKQQELKSHFMSYYDDVTGIPNRRFFSTELKKIIEINKAKGTKVALIFIDLDNFKLINDTYGHDMGDAVLVKACEILYSILGENCILARFGGDEFVIAMQDIREYDEIKVILDEILLKLKKSIQINGKDVYCALSIGVSIYPDDAEDISLLFKTADMAMYKAKSNGKNRYEFFDINILNSTKREYEIEKGLRRAIEQGEIYMVFQPKIALTSSNINGFEALVRWTSKELGFVSPAEFIPIAETSGIIVDLGKFIIERSFEKCKELSLLTNKKFHFAINISDVQLRDMNFIDYVRAMLIKYDLDPSYIEFEITESVIMKSVSKNIDILLKLKEVGVSIALDDFGTGYSSLNYLRRLPIDVLKIDKSFIDGIGVDEKSECIAESIINLSHNLDLSVVAEGVETGEQLVYLNKMKCDIVQGYYFSKPESFETIRDMIIN